MFEEGTYDASTRFTKKKTLNSNFNFGVKKRKTVNKKKKMRQINNEINKMSPAEKKKFKVYLLKYLKRIGKELYGGLKFTLKEIVTTAVNYVGPLVFASIVYKYNQRGGRHVRQSPF